MMHKFKGNRIYDAKGLGLEQVVTAKELIDITKAERDRISSVKFIPPEIGGKGFGNFHIKFRHNKYIVSED
ncbi:hypothetical protein ABRZ24_09545 [Brenneria populi]|uniref:DNA-binding protein n=1 Tax=Brenneria populi TaxID=1505588 RepID=A0ABU6JQD0_9GAMM|nr:hypothetical protein [Brenneria populi Li et al. 2015]